VTVQNIMQNVKSLKKKYNTGFIKCKASRTLDDDGDADDVRFLFHNFPGLDYADQLSFFLFGFFFLFNPFSVLR